MSENDWKRLRLPPLEGRISELYHENSKKYSFDKQATTNDWEGGPKAIGRSLEYAGLDRIKINPPNGGWQYTLKDSLFPSLNPSPIDNLSFENLCELLSGVYGRKDEENPGKRSIHSEGDMFPIEMYFYTIGNSRLAEGIYHYNSESREGVLLKRASFQEDIGPLFLNQELPDQLKIIFFITGFFERNTLVFGERAYRYTLIEAGRILQNIQLISTGLGFSIWNVGEFYDRKADQLLGIDGVAHSTLYLSCIV